MDTIRVHPYHKVDINTLKIDGVEVTASAAELNKLDGVESSVSELDEFILTESITDISTAASYWVVSPYAGTIETVYSVINGTITSVDASVLLEIAGTPVTDGAITIAYSGSAAGDVDVVTPTAANVVTAGQAIEIVVSGASTGAVRSLVTLVMKRS